MSHKQPWNVMSAILVLAGCLLVVPTIVSMFLALLPYALGGSSGALRVWFDTAPFANFLFILLTEVLSVTGLVLFIRKYKGSFMQALGLYGPRWRDLWHAVAGMAVYMILFAIVMVAVDSLLHLQDGRQDLGFDQGIDGGGLLLAFVSLVVLPPIAEEIMFRGFLYGTLRPRIPAWLTTLLTSSIFAALHLFGGTEGSGLLWVAFVDVFVLSVVLCYLREKNGTIWASIGLHTLKNGLTFFVLFVYPIVST